MDLEAGDFQKREYCVQYRESDFEFVSRLLQEEGIVYRFEHPPDADGELLVLVDETASGPELKLGEGGDQVLYIDKGLGTARMQSISSLTPTHTLRSTAIVQRDFDWKRPSESPYEHQRRTKEPPGGEREVYDHGDRRLFSDDGTRRARHKLEQRALQTRVFRGSGDVIEFEPGLAFALVGHPGAAEHVDAHARGPDDRGDRQGRRAVVAQDIDAELELRTRLADRRGARGHRRDRDRRHLLLEEGRVAEVLDDHPLVAGLGQHAGLPGRRAGDRRHTLAAARAAGQRGQVEDTDEARSGRGRHAAQLRIVAAAAGAAPVYVASGASIAMLPTLGSLCRGVIVGSALRADGRAGGPVDRAAAQRFAAAFFAAFGAR